MNAQHSMETDEHGSPPEFVELAHYAMGGVDLDPASSTAWNERVRAARIITERENGLRTPWWSDAPAPHELVGCQRRPITTAISDGIEAPRQRRVFVNSPGDRRGKLVAGFWCAIAGYFAKRWITSGIWVGFNVEQLSRLQRVGARSHPLQHVTLVPAERADYIDEETGELQEDAPHASFVTLLSRSRAEIERFVEKASLLGHVVNGDRR